MIREEAINKLVNARYADEFQGDEELTTAHLMAIKALEQGSALDKISKEIDELRNYSYPMIDMIFDDVQKIIAKYKE